MLTVTATRNGRTWWGRSTYSVTINDPTGTITFHGYNRHWGRSSADAQSAPWPTFWRKSCC